MGYKSIIEDIKDFYENEFTMDSFNELKKIANRINNVYQKDLSKNKKDAKVNYNTMIAYLNEAVFYKLKETLHFEDEVINNIMRLINCGDKIVDIGVFDGNVVGKVINNNSEEIHIIPNDTFNEITKIDFDNMSLNKDFKKYLISSINSMISPYLDDRELIMIENNEVIYSVPNLTIYLNKTINKILVKYENKIKYYDIKILDDKLTLASTKYPVYRLSEIFKTKTKRK